MTSQDAMHLVNQLPRKSEEAVLACLAIKAKIITDGKRICPKISARLVVPRHTGLVGEPLHQCLGKSRSHAISVAGPRSSAAKERITLPIGHDSGSVSDSTGRLWCSIE